MVGEIPHGVSQTVAENDYVLSEEPLITFESESVDSNAALAVADEFDSVGLLVGAAS